MTNNPATCRIEFVQGCERHSSSWYKFYVRGLEKWECPEDFPENARDKHHFYQGYVCLAVPFGSIFSTFRQDGNKYGTDNFDFWICVIDGSDYKEIRAERKAYCAGNFKVISHGQGKTKAPRLMRWWSESTDHSLDFAKHCEEYIRVRGMKDLPPQF